MPLVALVDGLKHGCSNSVRVAVALGLLTAGADVSPNGLSLIGVALAKQDGGSGRSGQCCS